MMVRWRTLHMFPLLFLLSLHECWAISDVPRVWLVQPQARILEHDPTSPRLAETKCPTMRKDADPKSTLPAGGVMDIIWHNPYHLNGPIKFELLNGEEILAKLEPLDDSGAINDKNRSTKAVLLPDFECKSCVLRLTQLSDNTDIEVVSCADVQVLQLVADSNSSSSLQQSKSECSANSACGTDGECLQGSCYCPTNKFGLKCAHVANLTLLTDPSAYTQIELGNGAQGNSLQWRYDTDSEQLEFKFTMPENSWIAVGLRNKEAGFKCASLLNSKDSNTLDGLNSENSLNQNLNIRKIVGNYLSTTASPESLDCGPNEEFSDCPEFSRECESSCEWTMFPESVPSCPKSCGISRCVCKEGFVREANDKQECRPFEYCMALQASTPQCPKNQTLAKCGTSCESSCETMYNTDPCTATCEAPGCSCDDNYVRHNGECIFWADCPNLERKFLGEDDSSSPKEETLVPISPSTSSNRVYTSTKKPVVEHKCPTNETWNKCGKICETECSKVFDREECKKCGSPGCSCQQGFVRLNGSCIYWNDCTTTTDSTTRLTTKLTKKPTTTTGAIKTSTPVARGSAEMPPVDPEMLCFGEFRYPKRCEGSDCQYRLSWAYVPEDDNVEFSLETKMNGTGWTGVGFSATGSMTDADFIVVSSDGKNLNIKDMHANGYNSPRIDSAQNVDSSNIIGTHVDGVLKTTFLRKRKTGDSEDDAIFGDTDDECYYFLFPTEAGEVTKDGSIAPHAVTPLISSHKVCIRACAGQMTEGGEQKLNIPTYTCQNEFHYPSNCSDANCEYKARWAYDANDNSVMFEVSSRGIGRWTAIGFSKDGMENADIILGWVYRGKPYVLDRFAYGRQLPIPDPSDKQDIYAVGGSVEDDMQTITFKRKLVTGDTKTDLQLNKCYYFLFPIGGGRILTRTSQDYENPRTPIGFHDLKAPERSTVPVCICDEKNKPVGETPRRRRQADPFDERISPGDLSHLLPAVKKLPEGTGVEDAFACTDISLIELSKNRRVRAVDGFALSTESIQPDEAFGGIQSIPAVSVFPGKKDGATIVVLRKKAKTDDIADFSFADETGSLVFASGPIGTHIKDAPFVKTVSLNLLDPTVPILYTNQAETISTIEQRQPDTSLSTDSFSISRFETTTTFEPSSSTGPPEETTPTEFSETSESIEETTPTVSEWITDESDSNCAGSFLYPFGCKESECKYVAKWNVDPTINHIRLHLESQMSTKHYTAFGFSKDGSMANTDVVVVSVLGNSSVTISDQYSPGYGRPIVDISQNLKQIASNYVNGRVMSTMVRALSTNDQEDFDLLESCHYLILVPSGGALEDGTNAVRKHTETPISSKSLFCPSKCQGKSTTGAQPGTAKGSTAATTKPTTKIASGKIPPIGSSPVEDRVFDTILRVMGREWGNPLENMESPESKQFTDEIVAILKPLVAKKWKSLKSVSVQNYAYSTTESIGITEANHGNSPSILALTEFTFDAKDSPNTDELRDYLKKITAQRLTGQLRVDPNAVQVQPNDKPDVEDKWRPLRDIRNWTIIGIALLVLLSLIFLCLCCGFCGGRRRTHKFQPEHMSFGQPPNSSYHHYSASYPNMGPMAYEPKKADSKETASTDTQNSTVNGNSVGRRESQNTKPNVPRGIGETTYGEWYSKVASKDTPSHHQESMYQTPPTRMLANTPHYSSYVTYPNDPSGYYTLNGDPRMAPPPSYRHY